MGFWNPRAICENCGAKIHTQSAPLWGSVCGKQCPACGIALTGKVTALGRAPVATPASEQFPQAAVAASLEAETGLSSVELRSVGNKKIAVIKEIRRATGLGLAETKALVDRAGLSTAVVASLPHEQALVLAARIGTHGAEAGVVAPSVSKAQSEAPDHSSTVNSGTDSVASRDIPELIAKLAELLEAGIVTATEFEQKKTELLGRL